MSTSKISNRYGRAFFLLAGSDVVVSKKYLSELQLVSELFKIQSIKKVLCSPIIPEILKKEILLLALSRGKASKTAESFILEIIRSRRIELIPEILFCFEKIIDQHSGSLKGKVIFAEEQEEKNVKAVEAGVSKIVGKPTVVESIVNPEILGGFIVRIENLIIDFSLKTKLKRMADHAIR